MSARWMAGLYLTLGAAGVGADGPPVEEVGGVNLPGVTATVVAEENTGLPEPVFSTSGQTPLNIVVRPGVTELVPIARNYLNRIDTPFESPKLVTVNPIEFQKEGSAIFLTTSSEKPVGVHIVSNNPEDARSISLALIARAIPPQTMTLSWANQASGGPVPVAMRAKAQRWEEATAYEETLYRLAEHIARGEIPQGYSLAEEVKPLPCQLPGVEFYTGQHLTGAHFSVFVLRATNASRSNLEILAHAGCNVPGVRLVAPWPRAHLAPGESTEVYVAVTNDSYEPPEATNHRPSLLDVKD